MSEFVVVRCDGCGEQHPAFKRMIAVDWPRQRPDGSHLPPLLQHYCAARCLQVVMNRKRTDAEPCRPWCVSVSEREPACSCLEDQPADNYDPWEAAGL